MSKWHIYRIPDGNAVSISYSKKKFLTHQNTTLFIGQNLGTVP